MAELPRQNPDVLTLADLTRFAEKVKTGDKSVEDYKRKFLESLKEHLNTVGTSKSQPTDKKLGDIKKFEQYTGYIGIKDKIGSFPEYYNYVYDTLNVDISLNFPVLPRAMPQSAQIVNSSTISPTLDVQLPSSTPNQIPRPALITQPNLLDREADPVAPVKEAPVALIELSEDFIKDFGRKLPFKVLTTLHSQSADSVFRTVKDEQGQQILQPPSRELVPGTIITLKASLLLLINGSNIIDESKKNQLRQAIAEQGNEYPTVGSILQALNNVQPNMELDQTRLTNNYELVLTGMESDPNQNFDDILEDENLTRMLTETPVESQNGKVFEVIAPTKTFISKLIGKVPSNELMTAIIETQSACVNQTSNPLESLQVILKVVLKDNPKRYNDILKSIINSTLFQFKLAGIQSKIEEGKVKKGWGERGKNALGVMAIAGVAIVAVWLVEAGVIGSVDKNAIVTAPLVTANVDLAKNPKKMLESLPVSNNLRVKVVHDPKIGGIGTNTNTQIFAAEPLQGSAFDIDGYSEWAPQIGRYLTKLRVDPSNYSMAQLVTVKGSRFTLAVKTDESNIVSRVQDFKKILNSNLYVAKDDGTKVPVTLSVLDTLDPSQIKALLNSKQLIQVPTLQPVDTTSGSKLSAAQVVEAAYAQDAKNIEDNRSAGYGRLGAIVLLAGGVLAGGKSIITRLSKGRNALSEPKPKGGAGPK